MDKQIAPTLQARFEAGDQTTSRWPAGFERTGNRVWLRYEHESGNPSFVEVPPEDIRDADLYVERFLADVDLEIKRRELEAAQRKIEARELELLVMARRLAGLGVDA